MRLCTPVIRGPVSAWSLALRVRHALPGATVVVSQGGPGADILLQTVATGAVVLAPLAPGKRLTAGAKLFVYQELGAEVSDWTDPALAVEVAPLPLAHDQLPPIVCRTRLHPGGSAVWIAGGFPGAEVVARAGGIELGRGVVTEDAARLRLALPVPVNGTVSFVQGPPSGFPALGGPAAPATNVPVLPVPVPAGPPLPAPAYGDPRPFGGAPAFVVTGVIEGAIVTLERMSDGSKSEIGFDRDTLLMLADPPVACGGDRIALSQRLLLGEAYPPSAPARFDVPAATEPGQPDPFPPCAGARFVAIAGIEGGTEVMIRVVAPGGTQTYRASADPGRPGTAHHVFQIGAVPDGARITAWQTRCGLQSASGDADAAGRAVAASPVVVGPLFQCARAVRVSRVTPGSLVRLRARTPFGETELSGWHFAARDTLRIFPIAPHLEVGWLVVAEQLTCAGPSRFSDAPVEVERAPALDAVPFARRPIATETIARVKAVPGAFVEIRAGSPLGDVIGGGVVDPEDDRVPLVRPLAEGEAIVALQTLCPNAEAGRQGAFAARVEPATKVFELGKKDPWPVPSEGVGKDVIWKSAKLVCDFAGRYAFEAELEIKAQKSFADALIEVALDLGPALGLKRGWEVPLVADIPGLQEDDVLRAWGYASPAKISDSGYFAAFRDPDTWLVVLGATAKFKWDVRLSKLVGTSKIDDHKKKTGKNGEEEITPPGY